MSTKATIVSIFSLTAFALCGDAYAEDNLGQSRQPLVGGAVMDQQTRRELGLVTVNSADGFCSASMLSDFWALTAGHCVEDTPVPAQVKLVARWSGKNESRTAIDVRSLKWTHNLDIALIQIDRPFPREPIPYPRILDRPTQDLQDQRIEVAGAGISTLAWQPDGGAAMPTQFDGKFRMGEFEVFETSSTHFKFRSVKDAGSALAGGDSGGPSYFRVWDDTNSPNRRVERLIAGVHSSCSSECLAGQTCNADDPWTWAQSVSQCTDASIEPVRDLINSVIKNEPEGRFAERPLDPDLVTKEEEKPYVEKPVGDVAVKESPFVERRVGGVVASSDTGVAAAPSGSLKDAITSAPAAEPQAPPPAQPEAPAAATASANDDVDIYDGPGGEFPVIGMMAAGTRAAVIDKRGAWYLLRLDVPDGRGWVAEDHLTVRQ